ncbi:MAG: hypothetical protein QXG41_09555 [Candidatus Caldarchaeum sp.]
MHEVGRFIENTAEWTVMRARDFVPIRTGRLRESINITEKGFTYAIITAASPYAAVVEEGRKSRAPFPGRYYMMKAAESARIFMEIYSPSYRWV